METTEKKKMFVDDVKKAKLSTIIWC